MKDNSLIIWDNDIERLLFVSKKDLGQFGVFRDVDKKHWYAVGETKRLTTSGKNLFRDFKRTIGDSVSSLQIASYQSANLENNVIWFKDHNPTEYKSYFEIIK